MQEITASSGQTAYSTTIPIPIQATGTLYVYVKCKSTISTDPLVVSAYISITITGGQSGAAGVQSTRQVQAAADS